MSFSSFFFAGGGTGGHIYPALAVAEKIAQLKPGAQIHFFCSDRKIDSHILSKTGFSFTVLDARGFSISPLKFPGFLASFWKSRKTVRNILSQSVEPVVIGVGGFVSAPVCWAASSLWIPVRLINVDIVPGKSNQFCKRWADEVFTQFPETAAYFSRRRTKADVVGCPLRSGFDNPQPEKAKIALGLDKNKKILLVTGASSGAQRINQAVGRILEKLDAFAADWQIVHLTGTANFQEVKSAYANARIRSTIADYYDDMADLLAAADLLIGRSGAVSVAEYAVSLVPSICMPYPFHNDMHQYLNAAKLVDAGAAIIVDDIDDPKDRAEWLWEELEPLMIDDAKRAEMKKACASIAKPDAAEQIAKKLLE
ncbi:MAG: UDP-N-acetylglucosamine--N-acetylmuramyl-(pentapeptide) pyrophosphoryl-undecaprenol N-acetylglucosamine transferase [Phycisphaerae bacterium]